MTASRSGEGSRPSPGEAPVATVSDALALIQRLARRLGIDAALVLPAREDPLNAIKAESDLPPNVELSDANIDDATSRASLRRVMEGGLSKPVGYVLPLRRAFTEAEGRGWLSEAWQFRREQLYLVSGDSPVGLRLPLDGLPVLKPEDYPHIVPLDPYEDRGPLPSFNAIYEAQLLAPFPKERHVKPPLVRTAISVEPRNGLLHIFMPPISRLEDYLELVAHLEVAAEGMPIRIEGYTPPG